MQKYKEIIKDDEDRTLWQQIDIVNKHEIPVFHILNFWKIV